MKTLESTAGLSSTTRCVTLSQEVPERAELEVTGFGVGHRALHVRVIIDGFGSMYYPPIKILADCAEGDRVIVEQADGEWVKSVVKAEDTTVTQLSQVRAAFDQLYGSPLDAALLKRVRDIIDAASDPTTEDGSIQIEQWHNLTSHAYAFVDVQKSHHALVAALAI
jgi:hypothetical protein